MSPSTVASRSKSPVLHSSSTEKQNKVAEEEPLSSTPPNQEQGPRPEPRRLKTISHARQSEIFCMVYNRAWEDLLRRLSSTSSRTTSRAATTGPSAPASANTTSTGASSSSSISSNGNDLDLLQDESTGNTLLHEACRLDPPEDVIRALQATCRVKNHQGATPLHIAASHRCSAHALRVLLDCASQTSPDDIVQEEEDDIDDEITTDLLGSHGRTRRRLHGGIVKNTSPTADLSNMGRAPIHYACMSFRGLDMDAFLLLLDETLDHGNVILPKQDKMISLENDFILELDEELDLDDAIADNNSEYFQQSHADDTLKGIDDDEDDDAEEDNVVVNVMSMKDALGMTPLTLLFRRYRQRVRAVISTIDRLRRDREEAPNQAALVSAMTVHAELGELWEKARRIVARLTEQRLNREGTRLEEQTGRATRSPGEAAVHHEAAAFAAEKHSGNAPSESDVLPVYVEESDRDSSLSPTTVGGASNKGDSHKSCRKFRIVHASVGLIGYGCPPEMIRLAISLYPHQVKEMDEDGNLPLHIAVKASSYLATNADISPSSMAAAAAAAADTASVSDDRSVLSDAMSFFSTATISQTSNPFDKVIKILLQHYPEGARTPQGQTGELPLIMAIEANCRTWDDGIRTLLNAFPPALHNKKVIEPEIFPCVLARITSGSPDPEVGISRSIRLATTDNAAIAAARSDDSVGQEDNSGRTSNFVPPTRSVPPPSTSNRPFSRRNKKYRHDACARTTLFELLRTKPDWLTPEGRDLDSPARNQVHKLAPSTVSKRNFVPIRRTSSNREPDTNEKKPSAPVSPVLRGRPLPPQWRR